MNRRELARRLEALDPETDHQEIVRLIGRHEFGWENTRALELALFRTFASPRISGLLDRTQEFAKRGQKRYDDTALVMAEIVEHGYDSERGRAALRRMNQIHGRFRIANEDYLYVLSTFVLEPFRWNPWLAWRPLTAKEKQASFYFWREVGRRMNIRDLPESLEAFAAFSLDYERRNFAYAESNRRVADATLAVFLGWFPGFLSPLMRRVVYAVMDDPLREAFGYPKQPAWLTRLLFKAARLRAWAAAQLPVRPYVYTEMRHRTYPAGYSVDQLGPDLEGVKP